MNFLQDVAKLGAEQSATALSTLLKMSVSVNALKAVPLDGAEVAPPASASDVDLFVGVYFSLHGDRVGTALLILSRGDACQVVDAASRKALGTTTVMDDYARSTVCEVGNIMVGAFLAAVRKLVPLLLVHSVPHLVIDQWRRLFGALVAGQGAPLSLVECELVVEKMNARCTLVIVADMDEHEGSARSARVARPRR